jgi:hypothetical protein
MEEVLYKTIKMHWQYVHPVSKVLTTIDYFVEKAIRIVSLRIDPWIARKRIVKYGSD